MAGHLTTSSPATSDNWLALESPTEMLAGMDEAFPLLAIPAFEHKNDRTSSLTAKACASSLMRSLFSGTAIVFRNQEMPLFKVGRNQVEEIHLPLVITEEGDAARRRISGHFLAGLPAHMKPSPRQWVVVADSATLALRNIDHLFPPDLDGPSAPAQIDFLWADSGGRDPETGETLITRGFWAVRGEHLPLVLDGWKKALAVSASTSPLDDTRAWTRLVRGLDLPKKRFEHAEVTAPALNGIDWQALHSSALVTVPDWPADERTRFIQSLYFGTYLGDDSGMMLNILEA